MYFIVIDILVLFIIFIDILSSFYFYKFCFHLNFVLVIWCAFVILFFYSSLYIFH